MAIAPPSAPVPRGSGAAPPRRRRGVPQHDTARPALPLPHSDAETCTLILTHPLGVCRRRHWQSILETIVSVANTSTSTLPPPSCRGMYAMSSRCFVPFVCVLVAVVVGIIAHLFHPESKINA